MERIIIELMEGVLDLALEFIPDASDFKWKNKNEHKNKKQKR